LTDQKLDNITYAHITYNAYGQVDNITYPNAGQQKVVMARDVFGKVNSLTYTLGDGTTTISDSVTRSQSNQITTDVVASGSNSLWYGYSYDGAGRLTGATAGPHTYTYGYGTEVSSCNTVPGNNPNAGKNSNRTMQTIDGTTTTFCYDQADRLMSSSDTLYNGGDYDTHGNMTSVGSGNTPLRLCYDSSDRNTCMTQRDGNGTGIAMYYNRDVQGRIAARFKNALTNWNAAAAGDYYYGFTGSGDIPDFVRDASWNVIEKNIELPGGVIVTIKPQETVSANKVIYSMPNNHGDTLLTTNALGANISNGNGPASSFTYDPFGVVIAGSTLPSNADQASYGWLGRHEKLTESQFATTPVQMGQRVYIPGTGRFLQIDSIEGGTPNNYVYPPDPINDFDLTGTIGYKKWFTDRWSNVKSGFKKAQQTGDKVSKWCDRGYWNGVGCNAGFSLMTLGKGSRGAREPVSKMTRFEVRIKAQTLGYTKTIPANKVPFDSHGQPAYQKGSRYITPDVDAHKGGVWKMYEVKGGQPKRLGTYDEKLNRIGD
jgi:RHS repeat-associated protein